MTSPPSEYIDEESDPAILRKREFVYNEIVTTEKDYLNDLKIILDVSIVHVHVHVVDQNGGI